jgi:hypothetical protein
VIFIGDVTVGTAFYELLPEASNPRGYPWLLQPDVIRASTWARQNLGVNERFASTATDAEALATQGEQNTLAENQVWPIFFAEAMNATVVKGIRSTQVHYLLIDQRITAGVPPTPGYYFSPAEPGAGTYKHAFPAAALQKFSTSRCAQTVYSTGLIQIIDVSRIADGSCVPDQNGTNPTYGVFE